MKRNFIYKNESSSKFWNIEIKTKSFTVTFGKLGTKGQSRTKEFEDAETCRKEAEKLIKEKLKNGYEEAKEKKTTDRVKKAKAEAQAQEKKSVKTKASPFAGNKLKNPIEKTEDLKGGKLPLFMAFFMLNDMNEQKEFLTIVQKNKGKYKELLKNYAAFYGYKPAKECIELEECYAAYAEFFDSISDVWMLEGDLAYVENLLNKQKKIKDLINDYNFLFTILTGLERFGSDPCGDSCFINTLPNPMDMAEVYGYSHETGELNGYVAYSLADFVSNNWSSSYDDSDEEIVKLTAANKKNVELFNGECEKERKKRPYYHEPETLFKRADWLMGHACGEPTFQFAEKMADAPSYEVWEKEKKLVPEIPAIANYWLLAHFFLGNTNACRACIALARKTPGKVSRELALLIEDALDNLGKKGFKLGKLSGEKVAKLLTQTQKNAAPELLEPEARKSIAKARGEDKIKKLSETKFMEKIQAGADPMQIINEYPEDIPTHDKALKEVGKKDKAFMQLVEEYFRERADEVYNDWPYKIDKLDKRLSLPVSAAFCAGLKFDQDNKKAFSGITRTLGKFDDDNALAAYKMAFQMLNPSDERLKYINTGLKHSIHPASREIIKFGAWRFFEILQLAKENEDALKENREKHGLTLGNMFEVENNFLPLMHMVLGWNDDESVKLADAILNEHQNAKIFKTALGKAFRIAGNFKMEKHLEYVSWYVSAVGRIKAEQRDTFIESNTLLNFTEACLAYSKMAPDEARPQLKELFERVTKSPFMDLDIKSGVSGGLLILNSQDTELLNLIQRLLGNRNSNARIYGALRAVAEVRFDELTVEKIKKWVKYHLYFHVNDFFPHHFAIKDTAWETIEVLGEKNLPKFDEKTQFALGLKEEELADAFLRPDKYFPRSVCERIVEKKYSHPVLITRLRDYLIDILAYSADEERGLDEFWKGFKALILQGRDALPAFAELLKLEHISLNYCTDTRYAMRFVEDEATIREWLSNANDAEVLKQLNNPEPRFIPWLDLLAAHAFFFNSEESKKAIANTLKSRLSTIRGHIIYADEEPTVVRLPLIYAAYGEPSHELLQSLITKDEKDYSKNKLLENALHVASYEYKIDIFKGQSLISLINKIKGENSNDALHTIDIACKGNAVDFQCSLENVYFQNIVDDRKVKSSGSITCESNEKAMELATRIANECLLAGYKEKTMNKRKKGA